jgi:hypothetical protein
MDMVIYYQGEADARSDRSNFYLKQLTDLRAVFGVIFSQRLVIAQLPSESPSGSPRDWEVVRQAQAQVAEGWRNVRLATGPGDPGDLHPRDKGALAADVFQQAKSLLPDFTR